MRLWHTAAATSAQFDDPNLVSHAGLVPVMRLAQDCGLAELVAEQVMLAGPLGANTPWAQPVLAFDLVDSVGQDAPCARC